MKFVQVKDVQNMHTEIHIHAYIKSKDEPRQVTLKSGKQAHVCDAVIYDNSGEVGLSLWDDNIERFHEGDQIEITNGYTSEYRGKVQLNIGQYGRIEKIE